MAKGQKFCSNPSCGKPSGPRSFVCKHCNTQFTFKAQSKEQKNTKVIRDVDWKTLVKGDRIKVGGGPYYMNKEGEFLPMGYRGRFVVDSLDNKGIKAYGIDKHTGFAYIWMGEDKKDNDTGIFKTKHKLMKLKQKTVLV